MGMGPTQVSVSSQRNRLCDREQESACAGAALAPTVGFMVVSRSVD
jgi:hypothetical protein